MTDARISGLGVLIVDDSRLLNKLLRQMLESSGFSNVDSASGAAEAEEKMAKRRYDVLFLDWRMKDKSGVALMRQCRENRAYDSVAFVIVSGEDGQIYIDEALKSGATSYIVKPFTFAVLQEHLEKVIKWLEARGRFDKPPSSPAS